VISSNRLEPGKTGQVKATVDTTGKVGYLVKHVTVYSNDRVTPVLPLTISLDVIPPVQKEEKKQQEKNPL